MQVWNMLHAAYWNTGRKKSPKIRYLHTITQPCWATYRQSEKKLVKQQYLRHVSSQYGELQPTSGWNRFVSLGTPANLNGFRVMASLLQRRRSTEVNQTLHDVWPSPRLVHYICIFGGSCPVTEFYQVQNSLSIQVLRSPIFAALLHGTRVVGVSQTAALSRGRHLYSAGWPSRWALALILVLHTLLSNANWQFDCEFEVCIQVI